MNGEKIRIYKEGKKNNNLAYIDLLASSPFLKYMSLLMKSTRYVIWSFKKLILTRNVIPHSALEG